jgi:hypothetical protein
MLAGCAGLGAVLPLSIVCVLLGLAGFLMGIIGPLTQRGVHVEDGHVFAAIFLGLMGMIGGLLEFFAWRGWSFFPH